MVATPVTKEKQSGHNRLNLTIVNNLYFQNIILSKHFEFLINFDLFPKNDDRYFVAYFD